MSRVTIRQSLVRSIAATVLLLGFAVLAVNGIAARRAISELSALAISEALGQVTSEVRAFAAPVELHLRTLGELAGEGLLDPGDPERVRRLVEPFMRRHPQITSVLVADDTGRETMLLRSAHGWRLRLTPGDEPGDAGPFAGIAAGEVRWRERPDDPAATDRTFDEARDYDPRDRPWWRAASAAIPGGVAWTAPYRFYTTGDPGITAATAVVHPDGRGIVIGLDVTLDDLSHFMDRLQVTPGTIALLLAVQEDGDPRLLALPVRATEGDDERRRAAILQPVRAVEVPIVRDAIAARAGRENGGDVLPERFLSGGRAWWSDARPTLVADGLPMVVAILVPESDVLGDVAVVRLVILGVVGVILAGGIARAARLAGRYSRPIELLVAQSERISRGDLDDPGTTGMVETSIVEVTRLAEAHERMRVGLQSLLRLERDLQIARQIQQSTFPETLPEVPGYDVAAWSEPADETGGDAYDVIGLVQNADGRLRVAADGSVEGALFLLADATGHGVGPALSAAQVRGMVRMAARNGSSITSTLRNLNAQLAEDLPASRFVTAWLGRIDARDHRLVSFSAGQAPLLHWIAAERRFETFDADTLPLGLVPELGDDRHRELHLAPGDAFVALSDGFFEMAREDGSMLGQEAVEALIAGAIDRGAEAVLEALRQGSDDFAAGEPARDDRTAVILRRRPQPGTRLGPGGGTVPA